VSVAPVVTASVVVLSPMREMALPPMVTGTLIGATGGLTPRLDWPPPVVGGMRPVVPGATVGAAAVVVLSPAGVMALPPMVPGTLIGAFSWVAPRVDCSLSLHAALGIVVSVAPVVTASVVVLSPMREMALPPMVTGTLIG